MRFVCLSVCAKGQECKKIRDLVSLALPQRWGHRKKKVAWRTAVASKLYLAKKGKITGNDQAAISSQFPRTRAFFDHSLTCSALGAPSGVQFSTGKQHADFFFKSVNAPEIIQAVEGEQGAAAGPARTSRRWLHDMGQHKSMIDPSLPVQHDYNFSKTFCTAFETLNPGSIAKIYTTEVNDEERFDGVCLCFRPQILRIVRADIRAFTLDACFIKHEQNNLKALYTLCSMDSKANLVCLAHCFFDKENQVGYDMLLGLCQQVKMEDEGTTFEKYLKAILETAAIPR